MEEHQNVHQVINQTLAVLGLPLYRKGYHAYSLIPQNRTVSHTA